MKTIALIVFAFSTLVFAIGFPGISIVNMSGPGRVTTLDRAGVINEEILKRDFPALAKNTRYNVGNYITASHDTALRIFISFGFVVSLFGLIQAIQNRKTPSPVAPDNDHNRPESCCARPAPAEATSDLKR